MRPKTAAEAQARASIRRTAESSPCVNEETRRRSAARHARSARAAPRLPTSACDCARVVQCVCNDVGERRDVAQRKIEALARDGMQAQRGVADQHGALAVHGAARDARERVQVALADARDAAEALTERALAARARNASPVECCDALRIARRATSRSRPRARP